MDGIVIHYSVANAVAPCDELISINAITSQIRLPEKFTYKWKAEVSLFVFYVENRCHQAGKMNWKYLNIEINVVSDWDKLGDFSCGIINVLCVSSLTEIFFGVFQHSKKDKCFAGI